MINTQSRSKHTGKVKQVVNYTSMVHIIANSVVVDVLFLTRELPLVPYIHKTWQKQTNVVICAGRAKTCKIYGLYQTDVGLTCLITKLKKNIHIYRSSW